MAHYQQLQFVRKVKEGFPEFFRNCRVLEVGSWDVTGTVRDLFLNCEYTGADVAPGPGVDLVSQAQDLDLPTNHFDAVLSCECFEHNSFWLESFVNMVRMLRPGGLLFMSCGARGRLEHGTRRRSPNQSLTAQIGLPDYYRNLSAADFRSKVSLDRHFACHGFAEGRYYRDLYFVGIKRAEGDLTEPSRRVGRVLEGTGHIALAPQFGPGERNKRLLLSTVSRSLETVLGSRLYQDVVYFCDHITRRGA